MDKKEMLNLAQWAMGEAGKNGANESAVSIVREKETKLEFRDKQLDNLHEATKCSLGIQIYANKKYSSHSTNDLKKESLKKFIADAAAATKFLAEDKYRSLPEAKYYPKNLDLDLKIRDASYEKVKTSDRKEVAASIAQAAMAQGDKII